MAEEGRVYQVVINERLQYSVIPDKAEPPAGWRATGERGDRDACLAHIEAVWSDIRPRDAQP